MASSNLHQIPGRHWVKASTAAKQLGVGVELINGLISGGNLEGFQAERGHGHLIWCIYEDQIGNLAALMARCE